MNINATTHLMRRLNRSNILDLIREKSPISRSQISRELNISIPTVMRIVEELMDQDFVRWSGNSQVSGGRPRELLEFNQTRYAVVGLDLGGTKMFGTVADLGGNVQTEKYISWKTDNPEKRLEQVYDLIQELLDAPRPKDQKVHGIGVGVPGVTDNEQGIVSWAPSLGWRDIPLKNILEDKFNFPVIVENDVNLAAMGEYGFGIAKGTPNLVLIAIGTGIGAGIVLDRKIYRGSHHSAGEVGYLLPGINSLGNRYTGFGALESLASGLGIAQRAKQIIKENGKNGITAEKVFLAAKQGKPWATQVISDTVDYLSLAIAAVSVIIDPEVIVLGGGVSQSADLLIDPILQRLDGVIPTVPTMVKSTLGGRAAAMGAIMLVLDLTTEHISVRSIV